MFDTTESPWPITFPISERDRHQADTFASQQPNTAKAEQVYRNTLAVLTTQKYLQLLGIDTTPEESKCWHPLHRVLANVADLVIPRFADTSDMPAKYLDCRPLREGDCTCFIPESAWNSDPDSGSDQVTLIGHVIVQLDEPYQSAHILGFAKTVATSMFSLQYLQPLADLVDEFLEPVPVPVLVPEPRPLFMPLHQWLEGKLTQSWQTLTTDLAIQWSMLQGNNLSPTMGMRCGSIRLPSSRDTCQRIEDLFIQEFTHTEIPQSNTDELVLLVQTTESDETRWQAAELLWSIDPQHPQSPVMTLKDLGLYLDSQTVALMVGLLPKEDGSLLILTRICPMADTKVLPPGLMLTGCDQKEDEFFSVEARQQDQYIQFKFTADKGDRFSLRVILNDSQFTELFVV